MALTKDQQNIVGGIGLVVVVLIFIIWKVYMPMGLKVKKLKKELIGHNQRIVTLKAKARQKERLQREAELLKLEVAESQKQLPNESEMDELLRLITEKAQKYGIYVNNFTPSPRIIKSYYQEIPIKLSIKTDYHNFAKFLVELAQAERIISASNVVINGGKLGDEGHTINSNFSLVTYMSK